mgnify:CR=1 FL=1
MGVWQSYRMRLRRTRYRIRAFRKRRELSPVADRTAAIATGGVLLFATIRNERIRLPYFLRYYREMGMSEPEAASFYAMTNAVPFEQAKWFGAEEMARWVRLN